MTSPLDSQIRPNLRDALRRARVLHQAGGGAVLDILEREIADHAALHFALREDAGVEVLLAHSDATPEFSHWPLALATATHCMVVTSSNGMLVVAAMDPWDDDLLLRVARALRCNLPAVAVGEATFAAWLAEADANAGASASLGVSRESVPRMSAPFRGTDTVDCVRQPTASASTVSAAPVVSFVDQALDAAFRLGASDVHFECDRTGVGVKHRLDGVMVRHSRLAGEEQAQEVISRIKVLAQLDITERRLPQDGRFRFGHDGASIDMRVSIMPSVHGEDAVLRLLDKAQLRGKREQVTLDGLGFSTPSCTLIRRLASAPSGMLLVTGPTGSGKTTTVYAALSEINTGLEKIVTIEDPVEYELPGVLQIPVNERKGLTFATGLRSILRHDPDRILVGEIRDAETAEIAVQSALTGHLVFTTVHANSVADVVGRFRHFGLDMFGFMAALNGVVVQRLVRRLCLDCRKLAAPGIADHRWIAAFGNDADRHLYAPVGCEHCRMTGYRGRFVVAEVHLVDDELRDQVTSGAPLSTLKARAEKQGVVGLLAQAAAHVAAGDTTTEEVRRVIGGIA